MVHVKYFLSRAVGPFCLSALLSCSSHDDFSLESPEVEDPKQLHTCELILNVTKAGYNDEPQTRSASAWQNGDKIYLTFTVDNGKTNGEAVYNDGKWSVSYYGTLTEGAVTQCSAVYFENAEYESGSIVKLSEKTGIYEDYKASYTYADEALAVTAALKPKTGRIRFAGADNDEFSFYGMHYYSAYDCTTGDFSSNIRATKEKVEGGYSPYFYGFFPDDDFRCLNIITAESGFNRPLSSTFFKPGESGYMTIPTLASYNGWQNSILLNVNGVEFTMIPVSYDNGNFFLAETETTEELWAAVMVDGSTKSKLPMSGKSSSNWKDFLSNLNILTDLSFRLPTDVEWKYAAAGGNRTQNYTYAGSNNIDEVAWHKGNSDNKKHAVRQLQPNELGLYDMSGNVWELVSNANSTYGYGGYFYSDNKECTVSYGANYNTLAASHYGLRVAMTNPYNK